MRQHKTKAVEAEYVSVQDARVMTGISVRTWRRYVYEGKVASTKVGRRLAIPVAEIRRVMSEGYRPAQEQQL